MKLQTFLSVLVLAALTLACNLSSSTPTPVVIVITQAPVVAAPVTSVPATETPVPPPTEIPTPVPTATPSDPVLTPIKDPVNCRYGPGVEWEPVGALKVGETANIIGKNPAGDWWNIRLPANPTATCWVAASVTSPSGNLAMVNPVEVPQALVTKVTLVTNPTQMVVPGCVFPYSPVDLAGTITTNGPALVEWHWEISQGNVTSTSVLKFDKFGTQTISDYVKYGAQGEYWVKLVVTKPNSVVAQANYTVVCGP
jgi:hypothetical protein